MFRMCKKTKIVPNYGQTVSKTEEYNLFEKTGK